MNESLCIKILKKAKLKLIIKFGFNNGINLFYQCNLYNYQTYTFLENE